MAIKTQCPNCGKVLSAPDSYQYKKLKCPGCGTKFEVLSLEETSLKVVENPPQEQKLVPCPLCGKMIREQTVKCRHCGELIQGEKPARKSRLLETIRIIVVLVLTLLGISFYRAACSPRYNKKLPARFVKKQRFADNDFEVTFPAGWIAKRNIAGMDVMALNPKEYSDDLFTESIAVTKDNLDPGQSLDTYFDSLLKELPNVLSNYRQLLRGSEKISGHAAQWCTYTMRMKSSTCLQEGKAILNETGLRSSKVPDDLPDAVDIDGLIYVIAVGNTVFLIECLCLKEDFLRFEGLFRETAQTLQDR